MKYKLYVVKGYYEHIIPAYREIHARNLFELLDSANINHDFDNDKLKELDRDLENDYSINVGDFEIWLKKENE